uniref:uncharacterized protein LOC122587806 n=1 Tax=Erigeron canadensis TaxID=72917 RepID=UPI001CB9266C|nr:uncharacterized protein LOC122587806 [Erigeron canadensis]
MAWLYDHLFGDEDPWAPNINEYNGAFYTEPDYEYEGVADTPPDHIHGSGDDDPNFHTPGGPSDYNPDSTQSEDPGRASQGLYQTNQGFQAEEELVRWASQVGLVNVYVLVTRRSSRGRSDRVIRVEIACTQGGKRRTSAKKRRSGTQKTNCPVLLVGLYKPCEGVWRLEVRDDTHNHDPAKFLETHVFARRMTPDQVNTVGTLQGHGLHPRKIFSAVRKLFPASHVIWKDINNTSNKIKQGKK